MKHLRIVAGVVLCLGFAGLPPVTRAPDLDARHRSTQQAPAQDRPAQDRPAQDRPAQDKPAQDKPAQDKPGKDQQAKPLQPVTVFLLRHAETDDRDGERPLAPAGQKRAAALARLLGAAGVTHLISTDYVRTRSTLAPLAKATGKDVQLLDQKKQAAALRRLPVGSVAVVAGHSNTIPQLARRIGGEVGNLTRRGWFAEASHDRLIVVTLATKHTTAKTVELRYGEE